MAGLTTGAGLDGRRSPRGSIASRRRTFHDATIKNDGRRRREARAELRAGRQDVLGGDRLALLLHELGKRR